MVIDTILTLGAPFPGNHRYDSSELCPELRFRVHKSDDTPDYEILDRLANDRVIVPRVLLENEVFDISYWYSEQRSRALRLTGLILHHQYLGDPVSLVTRKLLTDGIASSYPCVNDELDPYDRFWVYCSETETDTYLISDADLEVDTSIVKSWLENPAFDLVGWY
jgi:hypothetical protein